MAIKKQHLQVLPLRQRRIKRRNRLFQIKQRRIKLLHRQAVAAGARKLVNSNNCKTLKTTWITKAQCRFSDSAAMSKQLIRLLPKAFQLDRLYHLVTVQRRRLV